jgi:predicted phosphodiesterase
MIYITGDTHGDYKRFSSQKLKRLRSGDTLIICGDFGFVWNGDNNEHKLLAELSSREYTICFIDGTHENFDLLEEYNITDFCGGKARRLGKNLYHLMRGEIYEIEDKSIFVMGGGESPDVEYRFRTEGYSRKEIPTQSELIAGANKLRDRNMKVDYIITHEPSSKTKQFLTMNNIGEQRITVLNAYFDKIFESCKFSKWYFGSMHIDKAISESQYAVFEKIREIESGLEIK